MILFSLQKISLSETMVSGTNIKTYTPFGDTLYFEDNPSDPDFYEVPRRTEKITTMNEGGVNIDLGIDRSAQEISFTLNLCTQSFYNQINGSYLGDPAGQLYVIKNHKNENWSVGWKNLVCTYLATLPPKYKDDVPVPSGYNANNFYTYADVFEIKPTFFVEDYGISI